MLFKYILIFLSMFVFLPSLSSVEASELSEKRVELENVKINYRFLDRTSIEKESEITELVSSAFSLFSKLFVSLQIMHKSERIKKRCLDPLQKN
jgi:hypothetical protein